MTFVEMLSHLEARRNAIDEAIRALHACAAIGVFAETPQAPPTAKPRRRATDAPANGNGRKARTARPAKGSDEELILQHLRAAGEPVKPGELAKAMGLTLPTLRYKLKPLQKQRLVVITGTTASRRISLPGKQAKEEP